MATQSKKDAENQLDKEEPVDAISDWTWFDVLTCSLPNRCLVKLIWVSALIIFLIGVPSLSLYLTNYFGLWYWPDQVRPTTFYNSTVIVQSSTFDKDLVIACRANQSIDIYTATLRPLKDVTGCSIKDTFTISKSVYRDCSEQANQSPFNTCKIAMNFTRIEVVKNECQFNSAKSDLLVEVFYRCLDYDKVLRNNTILGKIGAYKNDMILNCGPYYAKLMGAAIFGSTKDGKNMYYEDVSNRVNAAMIEQADESNKTAIDKFPLNVKFKLQGGDQRFVIFADDKLIQGNSSKILGTAEATRNLAIRYKCVKDKPT